jgi:predicted AlkP superfamily pyrophosphatase or phosphodiesterase
MKRDTRILWILILLGALSCQPRSERSQSERHLILISIDGLRPDFYLKHPLKNLREMMKDGSYALKVIGVFPSVTYPSHATIATGVYPARHGICFNTRFEPGRRGLWFWEEDSIKALTVWQAAERKGLRTALIYWPSTIGASVDWVIPQRWATSRQESTLQLLKDHSTEGLLEEIAKRDGYPEEEDLKDKAKADLWVTQAAEFIIQRYRPHLILIHLLQLDQIQHLKGPDAVEIRESLINVDTLIGRLRGAIDRAGIRETTTFLIVGDHGFISVEYKIAPNVLLRRAGFIEYNGGRISSWDALAHCSGAFSAIYINPKRDRKGLRTSLVELFEQNALRDGRRIYTVLKRAQLDELRTVPRAFIGLEASPGFSMSSSSKGLFIQPTKIKANHGHLPTRPQMWTGFIAYGNRIRKGVILSKIRLVDIAPTISSILGLRMRHMHGRILSEILK